MSGIGTMEILATHHLGCDDEAVIRVPPPFDGTSPIYRPTTLMHWGGIGWPVPDYRWDCQESSGALSDGVRGSSLTASGSPTYQQASADTSYATKGVRFAEGTTSLGFTAAVGVHWNITYQSCVWYLEFEVKTVPTPGFSRAMFALTGAAAAYVALFNSSSHARIQCKGPSTANGTVNYDDSKRHPVMIEWILGAGTSGHSGAGRYRISTDKEQVTATWSIASDGTKGLATGGSASLASADFIASDAIGFVGTKAENISNVTTPKTMLQRRGWTVTGY